MNQLDKIKTEQIESHQGEGFMLTKFSEAIGLARANSLWP
jgi:NADH:ubiquinone oxidoreductase subunit B-like Fe-S oxidoreductase